MHNNVLGQFSQLCLDKRKQTFWHLNKLNSCHRDQVKNCLSQDLIMIFSITIFRLFVIFHRKLCSGKRKTKLGAKFWCLNEASNCHKDTCHLKRHKQEKSDCCSPALSRVLIWTRIWNFSVILCLLYFQCCGGV